MERARPGGGLIVWLCLAAACGRSPGDRPGAGAAPRTRTLSIATGGTSGVYYVYGGALARILSRDLPGVQATAEVTTASVENLNFVAQGSSDLAFTLADTALDAAQGRGRFSHPLPIRAVAALYSNVTHIVARAEGPVRSLEDLRGRRVSTGAPNSGTEVIAERVLSASGMDPDRDLRRERLGIGEAVAALKDGKVDAFFWSGGLPTAGVLELAATPGLRIRLISDAAVVPQLTARHGPLYATADLPDGLYPNTPGVKASTVRNLLVVHRDLPADLVYAITRALFERRAELAAVHPARPHVHLLLRGAFRGFAADGPELHGRERNHGGATRIGPCGTPGGTRCPPSWCRWPLPRPEAHACS